MAIYKGTDLIGVNTIKEKKIYVEVPEGSTIEDMGEDNTIAISPEEFEQLQDAINYREGKYSGNSTFELMTYGLNQQYFLNRHDQIQICPGTTNEWTRPSDWPDLDSLNLQMEGDDFIYETFDLRDRSKIVGHRIYTTDAQPCTIESGYIENGEFHTVYSGTVSNGGYFGWRCDGDRFEHEKIGDYGVIRITGQIKQCFFLTWTFNPEGDTRYYMTCSQSPLLERIAWVPHMTALYGGSNTSWGTYSLEHDVVANGIGTTLTSVASAWSACYRLRKLDISGLYTPNVTNVSYAFNGCESLTSLNLSHWRTNNVTNFSYVFNNCHSLKNLNIYGWTVENATTLAAMFAGCRSLENLNVISTFNTGKVTTMVSMFADCLCISVLPVENFNVDKATNLSSMFSGCVQLQELNLSKWRPTLVTNLSGFLSGCWSLKRVNFNGWSTGTLTSISSIFNQCRSLQSLDISWLHITSSCTSIYAAFNNMWNIKELNIPNDWNLSGITSTSNTANSVFASCYNLENITGIENWSITATTSLGSMFSNCFNLKQLNISNWNVTGPTSFASMFYCCYSLKQLNLSNWQPSESTTFASMFSSCYSLESIGNIDNWDTSKCTNFSSMFSDCWSLRVLPDITNWDFSVATTLASMFIDCFSITEAIFPDLDLPNVTTIATMFRYNRNLRKVDISGWNIPKLNTAPAQIFGDCWNLREINVFPIPLNHSYNGCYLLNKTSILNILNSLPTVTAARTLNLMTANINQLQAPDKAIATNKGWTLAN